MEKFYKEKTLVSNPKDIDELIGKTFNSWTIIERISGGLFVMRCKCGVEKNKKSLQVIRVFRNNVFVVIKKNIKN
jgi:hypothetical protein